MLAAATVSFIIFSVPKDNADAAISAASSFNYLSNGAKYFYSNSNGSVNSVTVNSSAAKGSQSNPHVIHSSNQWIFFSNLINANNSSFNSSSVFFFIDNDLDFAGNSLNPVGSSAAGFKATLFGGKHSFKNARFNAVNDTANSAISVSGMFYLLNGAKIYDISIANSCTYSFALNKHTYVGTVAGYSNSASLTNVSSFANVTVNNGASSALNLQIQVGGLIGQCISGTLNVYLSTYKGVITTTAGKENSGSSYPDNQIFCGGVIGYIAAGTAGFTIDGCYINITTVQHHGGLCTGSVYGNGSNNIPATAVFKLLNTIIKSNFTKDGNLTSADMGGINGYNGGLTFNTAPVMQNVYSIGSPDWRNVPATKTNVVTNVSISGTTNAGSEKGVYDKAKTNSSITAKFDFLPD